MSRIANKKAKMKALEYFVALKKPQSNAEYFGPGHGDTEYFHFSDLQMKKHFKLPIKKIEQWPELDYTFKEAVPAPEKDKQLALYENAIKDMQVGLLDKVVLSRVEHHLNFKSAFEIFNALALEYPDAAVYLFSHPEAGTWLGASPETLLSQKAENLFIDSLAGTKQWADRMAFSEKEFNEQDLVSHDIASLLEQSTMIRDYEQSEPQVKRAGNLAHLHSLFKARISESFALEEFLKELQPTPAVGGRPRKEALKYIEEHELYPRRFYTGFFGLSSPQGAELWVNLRCAELCEGKLLSIYVGGGITAQSKPESEWEETEHKARTILNVLTDPND